MNFFKRLFGSKTNSDSNEEKKEVKKSAPDSAKLEKLEKMIQPLLVDATKIIVQPASRMPENSNMKSHFGGVPYFETGENWPKTEEDTDLNFVCQIFNDGHNLLPKNIKLIQFYYDFEEGPWSTEEEGWLVKIYEELNPEKVITIDKPADLEKSKYCEIQFENVKSLPDWEGLSVYCPEATDLAEEINDDDPWEVYDELVIKLTNQEDYQSQIGGYPKWVQGESIPENNNGQDFKFLLQIDSEDKAGIMWGDVGLVYIYYDAKTKAIEFEMQCH